MSSEFVTIKISKSAFEQLKEYRDENELRSITAAIQKGVNCLSAVDEFKIKLEEQKEKQAYYEIQNIVIKNLAESTIRNWLESVDEKRAVGSIECALQSFIETKRDPSFEVFENKDRILREIFENYINIIISTLKKTKSKSGMKNRISAMFLEQLLNFNKNA